MALDRAMMKALEADGEKLRQLTGEDHGPIFLADEDEISDNPAFEAWLQILEADVIQGEYGYEEGEFAVFPDHWLPDFLAGRTPAEAFKRALEQHRSNR